MEPQEDEPILIPEWVVTFGDMMSLLLTFFIMLVSLSEIKEEEQYQALVESMRRQFGYANSQQSLAPGDSRPRATEFQVMATVGRAKQKDLASGGVPEKAPHGEEQHVRIIRPGRQTAVGTVVFFDAGATELDPAATRALAALAERLRGKPQKIEVRGHTTPEVAARALHVTDPMDMAYARCGAVMRYLVEEQQIEPHRFRLSTAGDHEPMFREGDPEKASKNSRVEVFLLDETSADLQDAVPNRDRNPSANR
ncbi:OmpA/MotB family protein [Candidatus Laterigemmans baculatus]|uniref:OmpA/MotB family protein n=1 Tax=Candidatus Laterigemmans baculatus TaxID=2770505 RepID=UPI0013DD5AA5|nr:flagellar motor protein MotB [Candidatus Laterigemmans baculatus]